MIPREAITFISLVFDIHIVLLFEVYDIVSRIQKNFVKSKLL